MLCFQLLLSRGQHRGQSNLHTIQSSWHRFYQHALSNTTLPILSELGISTASSGWVWSLAGNWTLAFHIPNTYHWATLKMYCTVHTIFTAYKQIYLQIDLQKCLSTNTYCFTGSGTKNTGTSYWFTGSGVKNTGISYWFTGSGTKNTISLNIWGG